MNRFPVAAALAVALAVGLPCTDANAIAQIGGSLSLTMVPGLGACNVTRQVLGSTMQDTFALSGATPLIALCAGQSATADLRADAPTRSIGMRLVASGPQTTAAAQVSFNDRWFLTPPPGTPAGFITMPVSFTFEGSVAPGSQFQPGFGRFLDYNFAISDPNSGVGSPLQLFQSIGQITAAGNYALTFSGNVSFRNFNSAQVPMTALVDMILFAPQLNVGVIDFYNTAVASMTLPPGFTATTSSGVPLMFAVPEPATVALWALGVAIVGVASRRRAAAQPSPSAL